jgi:hypothetical protein
MAVAAVRRCGGILEHPANSTLWADQDLPLPGRPAQDGFSVELWQSWFGHRAQKRTWLFIVGCAPGDLPPMPLRMGAIENTVENMGRAERERTPAEFCAWLVSVARRCR